jgi:apolipoprotein D and lipocalin family protein
MKSTLRAPFLSLCILSAFANESRITQSTETAMADLGTIAALDVPRYMGNWYEIAKYPNWFQRKCVSDTKATYSLQTDGSVRVVNRCVMGDGQVNEAVGTARQIGEATSPKLEVRFAPAWLSFVPAVWGDYWVIDLDPEYQVVAISEPKRDYLWVLSRKPRISQETYAELLDRLQKSGFDVRRLERTKHAD